jgi:hypothetical protein
MPTHPYGAVRVCENEAPIPGRRGDTETTGTVGDAIRDVCEAIRLVKTNVERFVSRASKMPL